MGQDVPAEVKRKLNKALMSTYEFASRLDPLGDPDFVAFVGMQGTADAANLAAQARASLQHITLITQVARHHILTAALERERLSHYVDPPKPSTGNVIAAFDFTSFAMHAIAVERHMTIALSFQFGIKTRKKTGSDGQIKETIPNDRIKEVHRFLKDNGHTTYADLLQPFQHDHHWQWLRKYRNRWEHCNPMRVAELGMQFSNMRVYVTEEPTIGPGGKPAIARELVIGAGEPAETTVEEMLTEGMYCFNLLAKQVDSYISLLEAARQSPCVINL